jgi:fructose-1,6-bisphosphatase I
MPESGTVYSINQGYFLKFAQPIKDYITYCQTEDKATNRPYSLRYIGSMVADFHRNLINGGVFLYPATKSASNGKLRILYECNPMSFIAEQAGGKAINGRQRILEIEPIELHQRSPIVLGSKEMVEKVEDFINATVSVAQ